MRTIGEADGRGSGAGCSAVGTDEEVAMMWTAIAIVAAWALGMLAGIHIGGALRSGKAADSEEMVRCRECRFCEDQFMGGLWCNHPDSRNPLGCRPNDYCNDGERGEEDNG